MATFWATFSVVENRARKGIEAMPVLQGRGAEGMTALTTSGTSQIVQRSAVDWTAPDTGFVTLRADGAVWVRFAAAPTAAVGSDLYVAANERREFSVKNGDKLAVIDG